MRIWVASLLAIGILETASAQTPAPVRRPLVDFPTDNRSLLEGRLADFFMYVNRDFGGVRTKPWEGGQYGFVRGPQQTPAGVVYRQMHEGIDIKPVERDAAGVPLDVVQAAADGVVAYVSDDPRASNYGRYLVVQHNISGSPYFTLYAHLASVAVGVGQSVSQGSTLGILGYTGAGIDRERAHVHFEFNMMLTRNFAGYASIADPRDPNRHGNFNGRNLVGVDAAKLLVAVRRDPSFNLAQWIASDQPAFRVRIKNSPNLDLLRMYPWLAGAAAGSNPPAWTITFSQYGVPLRAEPFAIPVTEPVLAWVVPAESYTRATRGMVTGSPGSPRLSDSGMRMAKLLTYPD